MRYLWIPLIQVVFLYFKWLHQPPNNAVLKSCLVTGFKEVWGVESSKCKAKAWILGFLVQSYAKPHFAPKVDSQRGSSWIAFFLLFLIFCMYNDSTGGCLSFSWSSYTHTHTHTHTHTYAWTMQIQGLVGVCPFSWSLYAHTYVCLDYADSGASGCLSIQLVIICTHIRMPGLCRFRGLVGACPFSWSIICTHIRMPGLW